MLAAKNGFCFVIITILCCGYSWLEAQEKPVLVEMKRAQDAAEAGKHAEAVELLNAIIQRDDKLAFAYYLRGREQFRLGKIEESLVDFDRCVKLDPQVESRLWERGITQFYAGKFAAGAKQFELYQTYYDQDVENSVWRFICSVPGEGLEKARTNMLPIERDKRVPMMEIYELFRGNKTAEQVLEAVQAGNPPPRELATRQFYADLYLGLYYESHGKQESAMKHLQAAADQAAVAEYMGDVAVVHVQRRKAGK